MRGKKRENGAGFSTSRKKRGTKGREAGGASTLLRTEPGGEGKGEGLRKKIGQKKPKKDQEGTIARFAGGKC